MTDLFDRLAAKAAGMGEGAVVPAPAWGPGLVEDVQTVVVPPVPRAEAMTLPNPIRAAPAGVMQPEEPARRAPRAAADIPGVPPASLTEVQILSPAPSPRARPAIQPPRETIAHETEVRVLEPAMRDRAKPAPVVLVPVMQPAPLVAVPPAPQPAVLQPVAAVAEMTATPKPASPAGPLPVPAVPDIRISIGHIRVTAPQAAPMASPAFSVPQAPKGQALKAYLGWRR